MSPAISRVGRSRAKQVRKHERGQGDTAGGQTRCLKEGAAGLMLEKTVQRLHRCKAIWLQGDMVAKLQDCRDACFSRKPVIMELCNHGTNS